MTDIQRCPRPFCSGRLLSLPDPASDDTIDTCLLCATETTRPNPARLQARAADIARARAEVMIWQGKGRTPRGYVRAPGATLMRQTPQRASVWLWLAYCWLLAMLAVWAVVFGAVLVAVR